MDTRYDRPLDNQSPDVLAIDQQHRWRRGERVRVEDYLTTKQLVRENRENVLDLIYNEVLLREQFGELPIVADYTDRFPELTDDLAQLFDVHCALDGADELALLAGSPADESEAGAEATPDGSLSNCPSVEGYDLIEEVGRGGMGIVFRARHQATNRIVALKIIRSGRLASDAEIDRFYKEAEAIARLDHPNIVPVFDVGQSDRLHYFTMAFVDGETLAAKFRRGPMPLGAAVELISTLADAIEYAHQCGITHRDLKPQNILVDADGRPRIVDFGLAKSLNAPDAMTLSGQLVGTPQYLAPEQATGDTHAVGPSTDIHALGVLLYQAITGKVPFSSATLVGLLHQIATSDPAPPRFHNKSVPRDVETICLKSLSKNGEQRYASAAALKSDLQRFRDGHPILARPIGIMGELG